MAEELANKVNESTEVVNQNNSNVYNEQTINVELSKKDLYNSRITQTKLHLLELQNEIKNNFDNPVVKAIIENEINITEAYYHALNLKLMIIQE
jgi:hypothetical protein